LFLKNGMNSNSQRTRGGKLNDIDYIETRLITRPYASKLLVVYDVLPEPSARADPFEAISSLQPQGLNLMEWIGKPPSYRNNAFVSQQKHRFSRQGNLPRFLAQNGFVGRKRRSTVFFQPIEQEIVVGSFAGDGCH
jgi:hypothetical protein